MSSMSERNKKQNEKKDKRDNKDLPVSKQTRDIGINYLQKNIKKPRKVKDK